MSDQENQKLLQQLKDALVAIRKLKTDLKDERAKNSEPVAIIGMAMRFPGGADSADAFWELLEKGTDAITDIPADRFDVNELYAPESGTPGKINVKQGGFIDGVELFDSSFFDITPVEIESLDPQQRILLELSHEAMENAGQNVTSLIGSNTGVYVGISSTDYQSKHFRSGDYNLINPYAYTGSSGSAIAGRLSYMMGFQGPSMSIDTACSASIIAAHLGASALRRKECDLAVIGGVNLMLSPEMTICFSNLGALSPDARCKTFDNSANGYVRSEGCGVLVLKRLNDARRDGDNVLAVIRGSASNQDGRSNGFTAPNVKAQIDLIRKAQADAGLRPEDIGYVEAHGTGTKIGDPIEVEALTSVFQSSKTKEHPLIVGSVKSNIGHLEAAAGMASMIKAVLALRHGKIPQSIHFKEPNELIDWKNIPVKVASELTEFKGASRNIGISGFGITGTNGHIIIGDAPAADAPAESRGKPGAAVNKELMLLPLTAKSPPALAALAGTYSEFILHESISAEDICAFTALKRAQFESRKLFVARDADGLAAALKEYAGDAPDTRRKFDPDEGLRTIFVFTGQGAQWPQMGTALAESDPVFRQALEEANAALGNYVDWDVFEELKKPAEDSRVNQGDVMQPLLMAIGVALARWWMHKGIAPDVAVGHSMGEIAAAHIAGHITLDEAARIIATRSRLMEAQAGKGAMLATDLNVEDAEKCVALYGGRLSVSVMNSPSTTVIGGEAAAIDELMNVLEGEERWCRKVRMTVAAHTSQMDPVLEPLRSELAVLEPERGPVAFYSTSLDQYVSGHELSADYWVSNVRNSVKFGSAIRALAAESNSAFIEIGPHSVLGAAIEENIMEAGRADAAVVVSSFYREKDETADLYSNLGNAFTFGLNIDWSATHDQPANFVQLPNYPWQRERFWFDREPAFRTAGYPSASSSGSFYNYRWDAAPPTAHGNEGRRLLVVDGSTELIDALTGFGHSVVSEAADDIEITAGTFDQVVVVSGTGNGAEWQEAVLALQEVIKQVTESGSTEVPRISIITTGVYTDDLSELPGASGPLLLGMARTMRNEYPELKGIAVDTDAVSYNVVAELLASGAEGEYRAAGGTLSELRLERTQAAGQPVETGPGACFIVTGGTSGLGLAFAEWLAESGVDKIALVSRSGGKPETAAAVKRMTAHGAEVKIFKGDMTDAQGVGELIGSIEVSLGRITGVVHAAGLLDDGTISGLTEQQFENVIQPKAYGAVNLHRALKDNPLTHFMVFSSAAAVLGTVGQANYNGANIFLDRLMAWRKEQGLPATSVAWGNIGDVGMAASEASRGERLSALGIQPIVRSEFGTYFKSVFYCSAPYIIPLKIDFDKWASQHPAAAVNRVFSDLITRPAASSASTPANDWGGSLATARRKIGDIVQRHLSDITGIAAGRIREDETFKSMGLDSMMALQLRNRIQESVASGSMLPVTSIWSHPTVAKYTEYLIGELDLEAQFSGGPSAKGPAMNEHQLRELVKSSVAEVTRIPHHRIRESDTFKSMGMDSMQALQVRNKLQEKTGLVLAASSIWSHPTVEKYADFLAAQFGGDTGSEPTAPGPAASETASLESEVEDLSLDELMKQLEDKSKEH